jgi:hypothetical protein
MYLKGKKIQPPETDEKMKKISCFDKLGSSVPDP